MQSSGGSSTPTRQKCTAGEEEPVGECCATFSAEQQGSEVHHTPQLLSMVSSVQNSEARELSVLDPHEIGS